MNKIQPPLEIQNNKPGHNPLRYAFVWKTVSGNGEHLLYIDACPASTVYAADRTAQAG